MKVLFVADYIYDPETKAFSGTKTGYGYMVKDILDEVSKTETAFLYTHKLSPSIKKNYCLDRHSVYDIISNTRLKDILTGFRCLFSTKDTINRKLHYVFYHVDKGEWGMDILHVGNTSGCGGLILYVNGDAYPVRSGSDKGNPAFSGEVLTESDDMVQLEMKATGVGPEDAPFTVAIRPSAYAGAKYSVVEVLVEGGHPEDEIALGIGLTRLQDETFCPEYASGIMASWGFQDPEIGFMGMGILFPANLFLREDEQMDEHRVVIGCETGVPVRYFIQGDWLRGHQYPVYPSAHDWFDTLKEVHKTVYPDS